MPISLDTLLSQQEANDYQVSGNPVRTVEVVEVPVSLNRESFSATVRSVIREVELATTHAYLPEISVEQLYEYSVDVLRIRVAESREDMGLPNLLSPRVPSRGIRNSLRGLPFMLNIIGAIGWVKYDSQLCTLVPSIDWTDDGSEVGRYLPTPRHTLEVYAWLRGLDHNRLTISVPILPRDKDGVQAVMLAFWQDETLYSSQREVNSNAAFIGGYTQQIGNPGRFIPLVRYMPRTTHSELASVIGRKEIARRRAEGGNRVRTGQQNQPTPAAQVELPTPTTVEQHVAPAVPETPVEPAS
jgi:hypothetical protein